MKKHTFFLIFLIIVIRTHAQDYLISFSGKGATASIDTVRVENLTQGKSISLSGSETLRLMAIVTGNNPELKEANYPLKIYPNPSNEYFIVEFAAKDPGSAIIRIFDLVGRELLANSRSLSRGIHSFKVSGLISGIYTIKVNLVNASYSGKLVSNSLSGSGISFNYNGLIGPIHEVVELKSTQAERIWQYNAGDRLKFTGSSQGHSTVLIDIPTSSKTLSFNFIDCTDGDSNHYPIVQIGSQIWMAKNLKTTKYNDGSQIPNETDYTRWMALTTGAYCWYNNDTKNKEIYGALYNWNSVITGKLCPTGWHVPTSAEWTTLADFVGGKPIAGGKLKEVRTLHWKSPNTGATDEFGFTALPGGMRQDGTDYQITYDGGWWTSSEASSKYAYFRHISTGSPVLGSDGDIGHPRNKEFGNSVRCILNADVLPVINTKSITDISYTSAASGGNITSNNGTAITAKGVCWSKDPNPSTADSKTNDGSGVGSFTSNLNGLTPGTTYYVRSYSINSFGTSYGSQITFTTRQLPISANGLVAYYPFNGNANDESGNGNHGTVYGANLTLDRFGATNKAYDFKGTSYISIPNVAQTGNNPRTITAWVKTTGGMQCIISTGGQVNKGAFNLVMSYWGSPSGVVGVMGHNHDFYPAKGKVINNASWHFIATTFDGTSLKIYVDGILDNSTTISYSTVNQLNFFGKSNHTDYPFYYNGLIDDICIYNRALTDQEIQSLNYSNLPVISTVSATSITSASAISGGNITSDGGSSITARGICWSTSANPTTANSKTNDGSGTGSYLSNLTGLASNTKYYVRAYATNSVGTGYGNEITFTTGQVINSPVVTTTTVTNITNSTATSGGNVTSDGGATVTARGICWSTSPWPLVSGNHTTNGSGTGSFTSSITGLAAGTTYYLRAYATNSAGISYGNEIIFTTLTIPTVTTTGATNITQTTATSGGNVTNDGGSAVTARGVCWSTSQNPTTTNSKTNDGSGTGNYVSNLTGLTSNTKYYVRAYATNSVGTAYGNEISFTTGQVINSPVVTTISVTNISNSAATSGGNITSDGGATVIARGVCWSINQNPTIANSKTTSGSGTGSYTSNLTGLSAGTTYYVRAYATNSAGTAYGNEISFTTLALPTITTTGATNITQTTATSGGNVISDGGSPVTARGVCWSTSQNPTSANSKTTNGSGTGSFTSNLTGLTANTKYYIRAYATNSVGTAYGNEVSFTTGQTINIPTVTTVTISEINSTSAISGGNVTSDGGATVTDRGVCWSTSQNPTTANNKTTNGSGIGSFMSNLTGLSAGTTYYVRAYATNSTGTSYGNQLTFTTLAMPVVSTTGATNITQSTATSGGNVTNDGGAMVTARGVCWSTSQNPTTANSKTTDGSGTGSFVSSLTGLTSNTKYYVRAYATNSVGTAYGNEISFTTGQVINSPTVTTTSISNITQTTAISGGNVTSDGGATVTDRGVCYSTSQNPTIANSKTNDGSGNGGYTSNLTGLTAGTTYYVRAYATNSVGTAYGNEISFTTLTLPTVNTTGVTNITQTTATCGGNVTFEGGATVTARGVCWSTSPGPLVSGNHTTDGSGMGNFISSISGLSAGTTYYVRAYATNSAGTSYGNEIVFTTLTLPTVTTTGATNITQLTATSGGNVTNDGGSTVTARGVCWSTSQNPTIANSKTNDGSGTGNYVSNLTSLTSNTKYYFRAYATNSIGTAYGNESSFTTATFPNCGTVTDIDGNIYHTVTIGNQCWMVENLKTTRFRNGDLIANITDNSSWNALTSGAYCFYNNDISNKDLYGALYNWHAVNDSRNIAPSGWHVPTSSEWIILSDYLGGSSIAGGKLKETGTLHWTSPNTGATNETGFTALPGGYRDNNGYFNSLSNNGWWWSSSKGTEVNANSRLLYSSLSNLGNGYNEFIYGFSVRCIKDNTVTQLPNVSTMPATNITQTSAICGGNVTSDGGATVTERGVCYSTGQNPTTANSKTTDGSGTGIFTSNITGLTTGTTYYVRAYATNSEGTTYGNEISFTTLTLPTVTTTGATNITQTTATSGGNVTSDGGSAITARGVCWSTSQNPTTANSKTTDGSGTGSFSSNLSGLTEGTTYYVRAYATNSIGTGYGNQVSFITSTTIPPDGLVAYYPFNGNANDESGNQNHGTVNGATLTNDRFGIGNNAYSFNGVNSTIDIQNSSSLDFSSDKFTFSFWMKVDSYSSRVEFINKYSGIGTTVKGFMITLSGPSSEDKIVYMYADASTTGGWGQVETSLTNLPPAGTWFHIAVTTETGYDNLYVNGKLVSSNATQHNFHIGSNSQIMRFGAGPPQNIGAYFKGYLDDIRIYNRKLSSSEINSLIGISVPSVTTASVTNITQTTATSGGNVTSDGGSAITARGVCWSTSQNPTTVNSKTNDGSGMGTYVSNLTALTSNTKYYVRAYATNSVGTDYGNEISFTTGQVINSPTVTTTAISNITNSAATSGGNVTSDGGATVTARGVCWSTSQGPLVSGNHTTDGSGLGSYISSISGLAAGTTYYVRAYATNSAGTSYGNEIVFTTLALPTVTTTGATNITQTTATSGGNVSSDGGSAVTARGVCWSTNQNPTTANSKTTDGSGTGNFTSNITGLAAGTTYYVRAYAINSAGTAYGNVLTLTTSSPFTKCGSTVYYEGKTYNTIQIGTQCWFKENLDVGSRVNVSVDQVNNNKIEKYCYNDDGSNCDVYGGLYQWAEVIQYVNNASNSSAWDQVPSGFIQGICPSGWHVPSRDEWTILKSVLGDNEGAGGRLKETGSVHWHSPNIGATNSSGFTALPGGSSNYTGGSYDGNCYSCCGRFAALTTYGNFSSSTEANSSEAYRISLNWSSGSYFSIYYACKTSAFSVRCLHNSTFTGPPIVLTDTISNISYTSVVGGGNITTDGGIAVTSRGVCWGTTSNPTINGPHTTDGSGAGSFTSNITGLIPGTSYIVRAYATNSAGTSYGEEINFTTDPLSIPTVTTAAVTNISQTSATSGGNVTYDGGLNVTAKGICWSTITNPTTANNKTNDGSGTGVFTSTITGLSVSTTYYVRAYATNSLGTAYGEQVSFTTQAIPDHYIGENYGGGVIFYLDATKQHGLITTKYVEQDVQAIWGCYGSSFGTSTAFGTGQTNTEKICNGCSTAGIAARYCNDLTFYGLTDWFLPSKDELIQIRSSLKDRDGVSQAYWSSSEYSEGFAYYVWLSSSGGEAWGRKDHQAIVRCIRKF